MMSRQKFIYTSICGLLLLSSLRSEEKPSTKFQLLWPIIGENKEAISAENRAQVFLGELPALNKGKYPVRDQITFSGEDWVKDLRIPIRIDTKKSIKSIKAQIYPAALGIRFESPTIDLPDAVLFDKEKSIWIVKIPAKSIANQGAYVLRTELTYDDLSTEERYIRLIMAAVDVKTLFKLPDYKNPKLEKIELNPEEKK